MIFLVVIDVLIVELFGLIKMKKQNYKIAIDKEPYYIEVTGYVFEFKGRMFGFNPKNNGAEEEFTHIESGKNLNGDMSRTKKNALESIQMRYDIIGQKRWDQVINCQRTIEEHIKLRPKEIKKDNLDRKRRHNYYHEISKTLGFHIPLDNILMLASKRLVIDMFAVEDQLRRKGLYSEEKCGSLKSYFVNTYGESFFKKFKYVSMPT